MQNPKRKRHHFDLLSSVPPLAGSQMQPNAVVNNKLPVTLIFHFAIFPFGCGPLHGGSMSLLMRPYERYEIVTEHKPSKRVCIMCSPGPFRRFAWSYPYLFLASVISSHIHSIFNDTGLLCSCSVAFLHGGRNNTFYHFTLHASERLSVRIYSLRSPHHCVLIDSSLLFTHVTSPN